MLIITEAFEKESKPGKEVILTGFIFYKRTNSNFFFLKLGRINGKVICLFNKSFCKQPEENYTDILKNEGYCIAA